MASSKKLQEPEIAYLSGTDTGLLQLVESVRRGLSFQHFKKLMDSYSFSLAEWAHMLHVSDRTLQRLRNEKKSLDPVSSERVLEVHLLYLHGAEVFGSAANFALWMQTPSLALGGVVPKSLLDTGFGISLIKDELTRIEHGVLA